jgi:hypothetical protein
MKKLFGFMFVFLIFSKSVLHAQWQQTNGILGTYGDPVYSFTASGTNLYAGTYSNGVILSTDNGASWTKIGLTNTCTRSLAISGTNLFAGTDINDYRIHLTNGVFLSTDNGKNWTHCLNDTQVYSLLILDTTLFAGANGVNLSTDNGTIWTKVYNGVPAFCLTSSGINIFAGNDHGVFMSTNDGKNWIQSGLSSEVIWALASSGTNIFAGTGGYGNIYLSSDNGTSWTPVHGGDMNVGVTSFAIYGNNVFAGTTGEGVYLSTNNGSSWTQVNNGLIPTIGTLHDFEVYSLIIFNHYLFAGAENGIFRRPLSQMISNVNDKQIDLPINFSLQQNYPNPFNPTTTINYSVPKPGIIKIKVYDLLGRVVVTLVNENKPVGNYSVQFNAAKLTSGIYFYRMESGSFSQTKKLLLLK